MCHDMGTTSAQPLQSASNASFERAWEARLDACFDFSLNKRLENSRTAVTKHDVHPAEVSKNTIVYSQLDVLSKSLQH